MPSNYTGNPAATQAPAAAPGANVAPILALPVDADAFNSAAFYQEFKALADYVAWLNNVVGGTLTAKIIQIDGTAGGAAAPIAGATFAVTSGQSQIANLGFASQSIAVNTTLTGASPTYILVNTSGGAVTVTLPSAGAFVTNPMFLIKDVGGSAGTNNITIARQGADTIDGAATSKVINSNYGVFRIGRIGVAAWGTF